MNRPVRSTGMAFDTLDEAQQEFRRFLLRPHRTNICEPAELFHHYKAVLVTVIRRAIDLTFGVAVDTTDGLCKRE